MPLSDIRRKELISKCQLIFYGIPVGKKAPHDTPVIGNRSLAQVVTNRLVSIAKDSEEFKFMLDVTSQMLRKTKDQTVRKIQMETPLHGLTDSKGFLLPKSKKI